MKTCPVCQAEYEAVCPDCGFDPSCDYEFHPTLQPIGTDVAAISARKATGKQADAMCCPNCGHDLFRFRFTTQSFECARCNTLFSSVHFHKIAAEQSSMIPISNPHNYIAADLRHSVVLHSDGTVTAIGSNSCGQCDVQDWRDIVSVAAGSSFTLGLRKDGTVLYASNRPHINVSSLENIAAISAAYEHALALRSDGTVTAIGYNTTGQCNVEGWRNITAVASGGITSVGLRADGTVITAGGNVGTAANQQPISEWTDITAIAAGFFHVVGLRSDGTVVAAGPNLEYECDVSHWTDIVAISAGYNHTVGLKADGTIVTAGSNTYSPHRAEELQWSDIISITSGRLHTIGMRADKTLVAFGANSDGQCNVSELSVIHLGGN